MTKTTARRKKGEAGAAAAGGLALAALSVASWPGEKGVAFWAGLFAAGLMIGAAVGFREADCPSCGKALHFDPRAGFLRCRHCRSYAKTWAGGLESVADDYVAAAPVFGIPLREGTLLPGDCCVCRAPAAGKARLSTTMEDNIPSRSVGEGFKKNAAQGAGLRPLLKVSIELPHCAAHDADALIDMDRPPEGLFEGGSAVELVVRVRSYPYYRAALGL
ncbi:MAG: hypothetical protein ACHQ51_11245 [Elusimicrobiota bacterium]